MMEIYKMFGSYIALGTVIINEHKITFITPAKKTRIEALETMFHLIEEEVNKDLQTITI